jgi:endonuclease VIII
MPEGDVVRIAATSLNEALVGHVLVSSDFRVPSLATADVAGAQVLGVVPRGKHLLTRLALDGERLTLHTHFRMTGSWHLYRPGSRWRGGPAHEVRVVLTTDDRVAVGYRLPVVELLPTADEAAVVGHLGPDLLADDFDVDEAVRRLSAEPRRSVGEALLDQRCVAGTGTLFRAETLFVRRTHPWRRVADADLPELLRTARRLMKQAVISRRQVTTGDGRRGYEHFVFERGGRPCRRCGTPISVGTTGTAPHDRLIYWCPACQPAATDQDDARPYCSPTG